MCLPIYISSDRKVPLTCTSQPYRFIFNNRPTLDIAFATSSLQSVPTHPGAQPLPSPHLPQSSEQARVGTSASHVLPRNPCCSFAGKLYPTSPQEVHNSFSIDLDTPAASHAPLRLPTYPSHFAESQLPGPSAHPSTRICTHCISPPPVPQNRIPRAYQFQRWVKMTDTR